MTRNIPAFTVVRHVSRAAKASGATWPKSPSPRKKQGAKTIGILDLGAWVPRLPELIAKLNHAQSLLVFLEVQAPVPAGLIKTPKGMASWIEESCGKLAGSEKARLQSHLLADTFFVAGNNIRRNMKLDYLGGLTPAMIAGTYDGKLYWNHFSTGAGRLFVASTTDVRMFARKARRPFEAFVGGLMLAQLLTRLASDLEFHEDRGCLFDYNQSRVSLTKTLRRPMIENSCRSLMPPQLRRAADAMVEVLGSMK